MATFDEAFDALVDERTYQEAAFTRRIRWPGVIVLIQTAIHDAQLEFQANLDEGNHRDTLNQIRIIGALGLRAMEKHGNLTQSEAKTELIADRAFLDSLYTDVLHEQGELLVMQEYLARARTAWVNSLPLSPNKQALLDNVKRLTALSLRTMENHGAHKRRKGREV